ncbi:MAG: trypsin-like peptidase domain-containing protein [Pseudomonadota bacterium]
MSVMHRLLHSMLALAVMAILAAPASADIDSGWDAFDRGDYETAYQEWIGYASKGDAAAQSYIGYLYEFGLGVQQDYTQAADWYRRAAEQGDAYAQGNLGYLYDTGLGVPQDYRMAANWYRQAAEQGDSYAQGNLGYLYAYGLGVKLDYEEAMTWFLRSAKQGESFSERNVGFLYENGYGVAQDYAIAATWYERAADDDDTFALSSLGYLYENGYGVPQDYRTAVGWYRRAAELGDSYAQAALGRMLYDGLGVQKDLVEAYEWLDLAAAQDEPGAAELRDKIGAVLTPEQIEDAEETGAAETTALVRAAQELLAALGYDVGAIDGIAGPNTREAVSAYQSAQGLPTSGAIDEELLTSLRESLNNRLRIAENEQSSLPKLTLWGTGTGFFITSRGEMLTNQHVIDGCLQVTVEDYGVADVVAADPGNDLALLRLPEADPDTIKTAAFRDSPRVQRGETVVAIGFPLQGTLSSSGNITVGTISALVGFNEDIREYQFTAPIQPGNSGGPLLDSSGNVIGVVSSELVRGYDDVSPQNVNFAIKTQIALIFLDSQDVAYQTATSTEELETTDIADSAEEFTHLVECWGK